MSSRLDITSRPQRVTLLSIDLVWGLVAIIVCVWSFGFGPTGFGLLIFFLLPMNEGRLIGNMLNYDWFYMSLMGMAFFHKEKMMLSGLCWAYAVMTRLFPLLFILAVCVGAVFHFVEKRRVEPAMRRFALFFAICCILAFAAGTVNSQGLNSWMRFSTKIQTHAHHHIFGDRRVGLKHIFTTPIDDNQNMWKWGKRNRKIAFELRKWQYRSAAAVMVLMLLAMYRKKRGVDAMIWGLPLFFALLVSSRYYWSILAFLPFLNLGRHSGKPDLWGSAIGLGVIGSYLTFAPHNEFTYESYVTLNIVLAATFYLWMAIEICAPYGRKLAALIRQKRLARQVSGLPEY